MYSAWLSKEVCYVMPRQRTANGMSSIRQTIRNVAGKDYTYYQAKQTIGYDPVTGKQLQQTIIGKTKKEVAEKLKMLHSNPEEDRNSLQDSMTLEEWLEIWTGAYLSDVKPSTAELYEKYLQVYVIPHIGKMKLSELDGICVQRFYNVLLHPKTDTEDPEARPVRPISPKTVRNIHGVLHKALDMAVELKRLKENPTNSCKLPKAKERAGTPLDEKAVPLFLEAINGHRHEYIYKIALFTGLREGEVLGLEWDSLNTDKSTLDVRQQLWKEKKKGGQYEITTPKYDKIRTLVLPDAVLELFRLQEEKQTQMRENAGSLWMKDSNFVFTNEVGKFVSYRTVYDCFKRIVKKIGHPEIRFHDLRHTYTVIAIKNGDDPKTVQGNLGHATAAFTLRVYAHVTDGMKQQSADRMDHFIHDLDGAEANI